MAELLPERVPDNSAKRASDADRERVVERLREAAADGRLDLDEFEERMGTAYQARTYGELDRLTTDLPDTADDALPEVAGQRRETTIRTHGSAVRRAGRWLLPPKVIIEATHGSIHLDLTQAVPLSSEVEVHLALTHSSLRVIVPPGTTAADEGINLRYSSLRLSGLDETADDSVVRSAGGAPGPVVPLRLRLTGEAVHSSVTVRSSNTESLWRRFVRRLLGRSR